MTIHYNHPHFVGENILQQLCKDIRMENGRAEIWMHVSDS